MSHTRLFLENLPDGIQESEVISTFSKYGTVKSVEIKERKNMTLRNSSPYFAYINLDINSYNLQNCLQHFKETQWYGIDVRLQIAKESFLERLKREREAGLHTNGLSEKEPPETKPIEVKRINKITKSIDNSREFKEVLTQQNHKIYNEPPSVERVSSAEEDDEVNSSNSIKKQKIEKKEISNKNAEKPKNQPNLSIQKKALSQSECKRLDSLSEKRRAYSLQKKAIRSSLSFKETPKSNRIIFNDDDNHLEKYMNDDGKKSRKKQLLSISDSDTDMDPAESFKIKEKFQGKNGEKLMKLQSTFKNDDRFVLNEKFLDDEVNETIDSEQQSCDLEKEKEKEFEILGEILGKEVKPRNKFDKQLKKGENSSKSMKRFDPTQPDHIKYEMEKAKKIEKKNEIAIPEKRIVGKEEPDVSKEVFYEIKNDFRKTLEGDTGFSLLSMFGTAQNKEKDDDIDEASPIKQRKEFPSENPFRYDSSDDEDQTEQIKPKQKSELPEILKAWSEPFFFQTDDFRLQDGVDFVKRIATADVQEDFAKIRQNLRDITKNKVRSNLRKNRPFKKKLGGNRKKKLKRIDKAIKR